MPHIRKSKLSALADGALSAIEREDIQRHLETCGRCRNQAERLSKVSEFLSLARTDEPAIPPFFLVRVRQEIHTREKPSLLSGRWLPRALIPVGSIVLFLIAVAGGSYLGTRPFMHRSNPATTSESQVASYLGADVLGDYPAGSLGEVLDNLLSARGGQ
jgi:anti-sigma factor RsiW